MSTWQMILLWSSSIYQKVVIFHKNSIESMFSMTENSSFATISQITSNNDAFSLPGEWNSGETKLRQPSFCLYYKTSYSQPLDMLVWINDDDVINRIEFTIIVPFVWGFNQGHWCKPFVLQELCIVIRSFKEEEKSFY